MSGRERLSLAVRLLVRLVTPALHRDALEAELAEEAKRIRRGRGRLAAAAFLGRELAGVVRHGAADRVRSAVTGVPSGLAMDLRVSARRLRRGPGFTVVAVVTLALALGVTSAVFGLVDAFFLRPLPYANPGRLVALWETGRDSRDVTTVAPANALDWKRDARTLSGVAWFNSWGATLTGSGDAVRVAGSVASVNLFDVLGVRPALGGGFRPEHARPDTAAPARVVVLSHGLWVRRFGADPGVLGRTVELNDADYEVVGVMPAGFRHPRTFLGAEPAELWVPLGLGPGAEDRDMRYLHVVGRMADGVALADVWSEMEAIAAGLARTWPEANGGRGVVVRPVDEQIFGDQRPVLALLLGAAALVLLVACVNMANLLLARGLGRRRELAVRVALGSGRGAVLRQLLVEGLLLGLLGGVAGAALLLAGEDALRASAGPYLNPLADVRVDARVVLFTLGAALGSGLLFGSLPAFRLSRPDLRGALTAHGVVGGGLRARAPLVAIEAALTVALLFGAGLLGRSLVGLGRAPPGFRVENTLLFEVRPPYAGYEDGDDVAAFYHRLLTALEARPEIEAAGLLSDPPLTSENRGTSFTLPSSDRPGEEREAEYHTVSPGYFAAAGIPLLEGRDFDASDERDTPWVAVVDRTLARRYFGDTSPVGRRIHLVDADVDVTVVGVAEGTVDDGLDQPLEPRIYYASGQSGYRTWYVVAHTVGPAPEALRVIRPVVASVDERVPVSDLTTMERHVARSLATPRGMAWVTALFGALALALAAVGIYGVMAQSVEERTREIGVRAALGAGRDALVGLVVRDSARIAGFGVATGVVLALLVGRMLGSQIHAVRPWDPLTLAAAVITVGGAALAAAWIPARRAARIDPLEALRGG
ncbi:MAG: ABC transporter permease [Gemmatimonadota bacterium]|jgi:putative ABC transport system permease protein